MIETGAAPAYLAFAHLIIDDLTLADGTLAHGRLGGAGTYAALGAALVSNMPVALTCGVGEDLASAHRAHLADWNIDTTALIERGPRTPRSHVVYRPDGTRSETPVHGIDHFATMEPEVRDVPSSWNDLGGVYFFATDDAHQWPQLLDLAGRRQAALMWEISAGSCRREAFGRVAARLRDVAMFSINLGEARSFFGDADPLGCLERLRGASPAVIVLRMGAAGSLVATSDTVLAVSAAQVASVVDPTGAGNCYTGAFMAAWCQGHNLPRSAALAAAAAARVLGHHGLPPPVSPEAASVESLANRVRIREITPATRRKPVPQ
jgi:sugar/nucleoside kinase (ribokinase family)